MQPRIVVEHQIIGVGSIFFITFSSLRLGVINGQEFQCVTKILLLCCVAYTQLRADGIDHLFGICACTCHGCIYVGTPYGNGEVAERECLDLSGHQFGERVEPFLVDRSYLRRIEEIALNTDFSENFFNERTTAFSKYHKSNELVSESSYSQ